MNHLPIIALMLTIGLSISGCKSNSKKNIGDEVYIEDYTEDYNHYKPLVAGPMLGYVEHREAMVWLEVGEHVDWVNLTYFPIDSPDMKKTASVNFDYDKNDTTRVVHFVLRELKVNSEYKYEISIDGEELRLPYVTRFKTRKLWEHLEDAPDVAFLFGSCNYINDSVYDRPGEPYGKDTRIFTTMAKQEANFMLWLGDNTYLRPADYSSTSGMWYRYRHTRSLPEVQPFLAAMSHYAIWDDHDFGPNDGDKSFALKQQSLQLFKKYWANKTYGEANNPGIYSKFSLADAEFYLLDDRYHRSPNAYPDKHTDKQFLGKEQLQWLKENLLASSPAVNFRFIAVGNQVLNPVNDFECYRHFANEWNELMDFIVQHRIEGVVFLTGDRHLTEINFFQPSKEFYRLLDVTSSPLTSRAFSNVTDTKESNNPARIDGTLLTEQNFIKASISGSFLNNDRRLTFTARDADGNVRWTKTFHEKDLQIPRGE